MLMIIINRQIRRANAPAAAPKQYYKINLTRVFLDHAIQQLDIRFKAQVHICYKGLSIIPSFCLDNPRIGKIMQENFVRATIKTYSNKHSWLRSRINPVGIDCGRKKKQKKKYPDRLSSALIKFIDKECFIIFLLSYKYWQLFHFHP